MNAIDNSVPIVSVTSAEAIQEDLSTRFTLTTENEKVAYTTPYGKITVMSKKEEDIEGFGPYGWFDAVACLVSFILVMDPPAPPHDGLGNENITTFPNASTTVTVDFNEFRLSKEGKALEIKNAVTGFFENFSKEA